MLFFSIAMGLLASFAQAQASVDPCEAGPLTCCQSGVVDPQSPKFNELVDQLSLPADIAGSIGLDYKHYPVRITLSNGRKLTLIRHCFACWWINWVGYLC